MKFYQVLLLFIISGVISNCSTYGTYEISTKNGHGESWITIRKDSVFEYTFYNHISGYAYTKGSWTIINDTLILKEFDIKPPKKNILIEELDTLKRIKITNLKNEAYFPSKFRINGTIDTVLSDWDGNYSYRQEIKKIKRIQIFDLDNRDNVLGNLLADFEPKCQVCSYRIKIDDENIVIKSVFNLNPLWLKKMNRVYPLDSTGFSRIRGRKVVYKKIDTLTIRKPYLMLYEKQRSKY